MVSKVPNENIIRLRELTDRFNSDSENEKNYAESIKQIKKIFEEEDFNLKSEKTKEKKLKCYERMSSSIKIILQNFKFL